MPIFDVHAHFGHPPGGVLPWNGEALLQAMDRFQIQRVVLASWMAEAWDMVQGNQELHEALGQQERWLGYVVVNGHYPEESIEELQKYLGKGRFVGVKFHPAQTRQRLHSEGHWQILNACRRYGVPIFVSAFTEGEVLEVCEAAKEFSSLRFILGHMAEAAWEAALQAVEPQTNIFLDLGSLQADFNKVAEALARIGPRRLVFSSDSGRASIPYVAGMLRDAGLSRSDQERIFYRNAVELFGLERSLPEWLEA